MLEARGKIENIEEIKKIIERIGGVYDSHYSFTDVIFIPESGLADLSDGFVRVRILKVKNWKTSNVSVVYKTAEWKGQAKIDNVVLKKEFDKVEDAFDFIKENYKGALKEGFRYFREGWQYHFGNNRIFVEDIEKLGPSIEVEAENESELDDIFKKLLIVKRVSGSVPELMRRVLKL